MKPNIQTVNYQSVDALPADTADELLRWALSLADTKHRLGIRTSEWVNGGPTLEAAVGASAITQDELGHARSLYAVLREFTAAPSGLGAENDLQARTTFYNPRPLNQPWPSWLDVVCANVTLDRALQVVVAAWRGSTFAPLHGRAAKILQEERFHRLFGDGWLARLAQRDDLHDSLQGSLTHFWQMAVGWFGPEDDSGSRRLARLGIVQASTAELRQQWLDQLLPLIERCDLDAPQWEPNWATWNSHFRDFDL
jgi:1,2-phenylacetyl-CoA epoxidase catalytic subunit